MAAITETLTGTISGGKQAAISLTGLSVADRRDRATRDDDADGDERHHHGGRPDRRDGDAERDGGGDQHGAGERERHGNSGFPGSETLTVTTRDGVVSSGAEPFTNTVADRRRLRKR